jgi:hypothetical protein
MNEEKVQRVRGCSFVAVAAVLAACGPAAGPNAPVVVQTENTPSIAPSTEVKPLPTGDTSAVAAPPSLVVTGHVRSLSEFETSLGEGVGSLLGDAFGEARDTFDRAQPIDFAVIAGGKGRTLKGEFAVSFPLKNNALTRTSLEHENAVIEKDGTLYLESKRGDESKSRCAVAPSFGAATHRMICAGDAASLEALAPYLARTLTREEVKNLVAVHVDVRPLHETVRSLRALGESMLEERMGSKERELFGPALARVVDAYADFAGDMSAGDFFIDAGPADATATLTLHFESSKSVLTKSALEHAGRVGPPSESFLAMPRDAQFAGSHSGAPKLAKEWLHEFKSTLKTAVDQLPTGGKLTKEKDQAVKMTTDLVDLLLSDAPGAFGMGYKGSAKRLSRHLESVWFALEQDVPLSKWVAIGKQIPVPKEAAGIVKFGPAAVARQLPAGSFTLDITPPRSAARGKQPLVIALVPLGKAKSLVVFAGSDAALQHVVTSVSGQAKSALGSVPAIEALKATPANGFLAIPVEALEIRHRGIRADDFITATSTATASGAGGAVTTKVTVPKTLVGILLTELKRKGSRRSPAPLPDPPELGPTPPDN